jgi:putative resolvase
LVLAILLIRDYVRRGYIKPVLTPGGKWRFKEEDVERLIGVVKQRGVILYARVSSNSQRDDL